VVSVSQDVYGVGAEEAIDFAGIGTITPRPAEDLSALLTWLRTGQSTAVRLDFPTGTALPDGRLDLCKQDLGAAGARLVAEALPESSPDRPTPVRHVLLGTDGLGDEGAHAVSGRAAESGVETLYLGCNAITSGGVCRIADNLRSSPQAAHAVKAVWLKRNPLGPAAGQAAADLLDAAPALRTLDLVQTGLTASSLAALVQALLAAHGTGREFERLYVGGNRLGASGAEALATLIAAGALAELYVSATGLGDAGARALTRALAAAPHGRLRRLSVASNGIGPQAAAELVGAAAVAGVELVDLGRVRAARVLAAVDNRIDEAAADVIGTALAGTEHRLTHLVLTDTGMRSREAHRLLDHAQHAVTPTRYVLGKGIATSVRRRLDSCVTSLALPSVPADVAAVHSVYRTAKIADG
jgi:hypothetical protein